MLSKRQFRVLTLAYCLAAAGFFAAARAATDDAPRVDADGDGVEDRIDLCVGTEASAQVDDNGCAGGLLATVLFAFDSSELLREAIERLREIGTLLREEPSVVVAVEGHADSTGPAAYNLRLSERRASAVRDYLSGHGVEAERMQVQGFGEDRPVASNAMREGRARNRRADLRVIERELPPAPPPAPPPSSTPPPLPPGTVGDIPEERPVSEPARAPAPQPAPEPFDYTYVQAGFYDSGLGSGSAELDIADTLDVRAGSTSGIELQMSLEVGDRVHVFAGYNKSNLDLDASRTVLWPTIDEMRVGFLATADNPAYIARNDLNGDGRINIADLAILKRAVNPRGSGEAVVAGDMQTWRAGAGLHQTLRPWLSGYMRVFAEHRKLDHPAVILIDPRDFGASATGIGASAGLRVAASKRLELSGELLYSPFADVDLLGASDDEILEGATLFSFGALFRVTRRLHFVAAGDTDGDLTSWRAGLRFTF